MRCLVAPALPKYSGVRDNYSKMYLVLLMLVFGAMLTTCSARPTDYAEVDEYLMKFGYLPESNLETGNLRTEDQLKNAIRNLQAYANLPPTGEMDHATMRLLRKPRCGMPDLATSAFRSKRYTLQGQRWHTTNLTWSLRTPAPGLDVGRVRRELHKALLVWQEQSMLNFTEVNSKDADILVHFFKGYHDDGYPFDGPGTVLAHAFFPGSGRGGDAHFDEQEKWLLIGDRGEDGTSLFNVAAHEFGHSLGLSHSSQREALMFPWYQGFNPANEFKLPSDDTYGIQQLYGARNRNWGTIPPYIPAKTTTTTRRPYVRPTRPTRPPSYTPRPAPATQQPPAIPRPPQHPDMPDSCNTNYDAIAYIRRETFIFKGTWFWRIGDKGLYDGYPVQTNRFWHDLPNNFTHIDAVYERRHDKKIVFFIGNQYWLYNANQKEPGYPKPLTNLGLPSSLDHLDGAMVWGHNGKTYFFSGTMYWRFDEETGTVELDYPRDMSMWSGVGYNIDAVFQWKDGNTYFFKGNGYWKFNDQKMRTFQESPSLSAPFWMGCSQADELSNAIRPANVEQHGLKDASAAGKSAPSLLVIAVLCWLHASWSD